MKPSRWQYIFAHTFGIVSGTFALLFAAFVGSPFLFGLGSPVVAFWLFGAVLVALPLGWLVGLVVLAVFGPLIFRFIIWAKGGEFQLGEEVIVLSGAHRDRIARIYEVWKERGEVRLELGEQAKEDFSDVLSCLAICRTAQSERERRTKADASYPP